MTSPSSFNTVDQAICQAYWNVGRVAEGQRPSSQLYATALNKLNALFNFLQTKGLKLFTLRDTTLTLTSTNFYPIGPGATGLSMIKPLRVADAYFLDASSNKVPLTPLSWQEWSVLQNSPTQQVGTPVNYFVDKQVSVLNVWLWPTPDTTAQTGAVHLVLQTQVTNPTSLTDSIAFPGEWFLAVSWALADELSSGQPNAIVMRADAKRREYLEAMEGWDVEDAQTFFTPDPRGGYRGNDFV